MEEKSTSTAEAEEPDTTAHQSPGDRDQARHATQSAGSTPPWAGELLQESRRARQEVEGLRDVLGVHTITRKEAAAMLGVSTRTIQRYEKRGLLERLAVSAPGAHYDYESVLRLKQD